MPYKYDQEEQISSHMKATEKQAPTYEKIQGIANSPTVMWNGPYRGQYDPGQNNTIMDSIYRFASKTQPSNVRRFGEGPVEFALREKGFGSDISQLRDQARNLQAEYPGMKADALSEMIRSVQKPVAPQSVRDPGKTNVINALGSEGEPPTTAPAPQQSNVIQTQSPEERQRIKQANADVFLNSIRGKGLPPELMGRQPPAQAGRYQRVEQIKGDQVVTNQFDDTGGRKMFDMFGKEMTRADLEQMENMGLVKRLALEALRPKNAEYKEVVRGYDKDGHAIYDYLPPAGTSQSEAALKTLNALGGMRAAATIPDTLEGLASAANKDMMTSLAPSRNAAMNAQDLASANRNNTYASFLSREQDRQDKLANSQVDLYGAQADKAKADAVKAMQGSGADSKLIQEILKASMGKTVDPATGTEIPSFNPTVAEQLMQTAGIQRNRTARPRTRAQAEALFRKKYPTATPEQLMKTLEYYGFTDE